MGSPITFESLLSGARDFAHLAMDAHAEGQTEVFLLEAGVSVERLAKAALVQVHPTLLSEVKGNDDMLLHFAGAMTTPPQRFHTIGAAVAITRLRKIGVLPRSAELDGLIELRNGVAHLGTSSGEDYLAPFVETICKLLDHASEDRAAFWGSWSGAVQVTLDDRFDRVQKAVHLRMDQARFRMETRFGRLPEEAVESVAKTISETGLVVIDRSPTGVRFRTLTRCPACGTEAATLFLKAANAALLYEMELAAEELLCGLCGLRLAGEEEIGIAGIPSTMRCKVEDLKEVVDDGPITGNLLGHHDAF
ncbi:hypothetical protein [Kitasatospora sp. NPDC059817]|uniref:hypothetical protein n=1 Tax=Kitasatospora sp. NPDC059817 TaxID=3346961 RepID=UPI00365FDA3A